MADNIRKFIDTLAASLRDETFVKLTLSNYRGMDETLQKVLVRRIDTKKGERIDLTYRHRTQDISKNHALDEGIGILGEMIGQQFSNAHLFTTNADLQLTVRKNGEGDLKRTKPSFSTPPALLHDHTKKAMADPHSRYFHELGITSTNGEVLAKQRDKWTQINKFIEIVAGLIEGSSLKDKRSISVVDMGSGKGYLTFALYDYLKNARGVDASVTGIEARPGLVKLCSDIADRSGFTGLRFVRNTIEDFSMPAADITIALHACDTATDDAIFKGISAGSEVIITAPCCHKEIRGQIKPPKNFAGLLKHGTLLESAAEMITDGIRALLLEREGYTSKVFEFVSPEHTPKNHMIVGIRRHFRPEAGPASAEIDTLRNLFGIRSQRLDELLTRSGRSS